MTFSRFYSEIDKRRLESLKRPNRVFFQVRAQKIRTMSRRVNHQASRARNLNKQERTNLTRFKFK